MTKFWGFSGSAGTLKSGQWLLTEVDGDWRNGFENRATALDYVEKRLKYSGLKDRAGAERVRELLKKA